VRVLLFDAFEEPYVRSPLILLLFSFAACGGSSFPQSFGSSYTSPPVATPEPPADPGPIPVADPCPTQVVCTDCRAGTQSCSEIDCNGNGLGDTSIECDDVCPANILCGECVDGGMDCQTVDCDGNLLYEDIEAC